jgi:hypothetical protein
MRRLLVSPWEAVENATQARAEGQELSIRR